MNLLFMTTYNTNVCASKELIFTISLSCDFELCAREGAWFDYLSSQGSIRLLVFWALPCFILKATQEVIRILYAEGVSSWGLSVGILLAMTISWTYLSLVSLSAAIVFHLMCNLQVIHFDEYAKLLQTESEVLFLIEEHIFLRYHLSKISHRFRIFLLLQFLVVTASQFMTLFQTTRYSAMITLINGGGFAVSSSAFCYLQLSFSNTCSYEFRLRDGIISKVFMLICQQCVELTLKA